MKIIKKGIPTVNLQHLFADHRLSWSAKGIYTNLIYLPNHSQIDPIEFSTYAKGGVKTFKRGIQELKQYDYLVINNKLLIINSFQKENHPLTKIEHTHNIMNHHITQVTNELLRNQWLIIWHHDDARVTQALGKLAKYLNPAMVLYGIQCSKRKCRHYSESLPYLNRLVMEWKRHRLTSVAQTQHWMNQRKLNAKPWNSEVQGRIFSNHHRRMLNNTPLNHMPNVFRNNHHKK